MLHCPNHLVLPWYLVSHNIAQNDSGDGSFEIERERFPTCNLIPWAFRTAFLAQKIAVYFVRHIFQHVGAIASCVPFLHTVPLEMRGVTNLIKSILPFISLSSTPVYHDGVYYKFFSFPSIRHLSPFVKPHRIPLHMTYEETGRPRYSMD